MAGRNIRNVTFLKIDLALKKQKNLISAEFIRFVSPSGRTFYISQEAVSIAEASAVRGGEHHFENINTLDIPKTKPSVPFSTWHPLKKTC